MAYKLKKQHETYDGGNIGRGYIDYSSYSSIGNSYNIESSLKGVRREMIGNQRLYTTYSDNYYSVPSYYSTGYSYSNDYSSYLSRRYNRYQ